MITVEDEDEMKPICELGNIRPNFKLFGRFVDRTLAENRHPFDS